MFSEIARPKLRESEREGDSLQDAEHFRLKPRLSEEWTARQGGHSFISFLIPLMALAIQNNNRE